VSADPVLPYCGSPPVPEELWSRWRLDPVVIAFLVLAWALYVFAYWRTTRASSSASIRRHQFLMGNAGWVMATLALVSPLCALSVSLFAARAAQHVILTVIAAPLVVLGRPLRCIACAFGVGRNRKSTERQRTPINIGAALLFAVVVWFWHMPGPYAATFSSVAIYWTMHLSMFATAVWLWACLLTHGELISQLFASIVSAIQMGFLGAVITLSPRAFYSPHFLPTDAWGLSPLQDQQLGGAIMWVVGCTAFFVVTMVGAAHTLARQPVRRRSAFPTLRRASSHSQP
jgi:putative membrane protein